MESIKRYDVTIRGDCGARGCNPYPDPFETERGIWVDFNDYERVVGVVAGQLREIAELSSLGMHMGELDRMRECLERIHTLESEK
jgi:hypothetical protein